MRGKKRVLIVKGKKCGIDRMIYYLHLLILTLKQ